MSGRISNARTVISEMMIRLSNKKTFPSHKRWGASFGGKPKNHKMY